MQCTQIRRFKPNHVCNWPWQPSATHASHIVIVATMGVTLAAAAIKMSASPATYKLTAGHRGTAAAVQLPFLQGFQVVTLLILAA